MKEMTRSDSPQCRAEGVREFQGLKETGGHIKKRRTRSPAQISMSKRVIPVSPDPRPGEALQALAHVDEAEARGTGDGEVERPLRPAALIEVKLELAFTV